MSIPANIQTELTTIQAQVQAATPLANASPATIKAIQLNAINLVDDVQTALVASSVLDTWVAPVDAPSIVSGLNGVVQAARDQSNLSMIRAFCGRALSNLNQLV